MSMPFWRYMNLSPGINIECFMGVNVPTGFPMRYQYNDGAGWRDVTDIEWQMLATFRRFDFIVAEASRKLDEILQR